MPRKPPPAPPTDAELRILRVLWRRGPSTVRDVHEVLAAQRLTGYTTTLKLLQIMHGKGTVIRDASDRTHVFAAAVAEAGLQRQAAANLLGRLFHGSAAALVEHALAIAPAPAAELRRIRTLLDTVERQAKGRDA